MSFSSSPSWGTRSFTFGDTGLPKQRTPTPSVRQESVIENVEKKQRENLKSRLKLLATLPSRSRSRGDGPPGAGPSPMPVIVREPPAKISLPKAVPSLAPRRYTSVLTSSDQQLELGPRSRLVRRHSVGSLMYRCPKERSQASETNGNGLKKDDFKSLSSFNVARDDSGFNLPESSFSSDRNKIGGTSSSKTPVRIVRDDLGSTWPRDTPESDKGRTENGSSSFPQKSNFDFDRWPKISNEYANDDDDIPKDKPDTLISFEVGSTLKHETKEHEAGNGGCNGNLSNGGIYENKYHHNGGDTEDLDDVFNISNNFCNLDLKKDASSKVESPHDPTKDQHFMNGVLQSPSETSESSKTNGEDSTELINLDLPDGGTVGELTADLHTPLFISKEVKPSSEEVVLPHVELMHWDDIEQSEKNEPYAKDPGSGEENKAKMNEDFEATAQNKDTETLQKSNSELFDIISSSESNSSTSLSANNVMESTESAVPLIDLEVKSSCEKTPHDHVEEVVVKSDDCRSKSLEIVINKSRDFGLGFCIEGGKGHQGGDRPITVKRVFAEHPSTPKHLKVGDELSVVANEDMTSMSYINAWKFLRTLPDGDVSMTIVRHSS